MSRSVRCLLDKSVARRTLEGLLKLAEGNELTEEQLWSVDLLQRAKEWDIRLFVTAGTINILSQLEDSPRYSAVITTFLDRVETVHPTRYFKRWARRLRAFGFTREDAYVLALACFSTSHGVDVLGMDLVVTYDQAMITHWSVQKGDIRERLKAMRDNLHPPYDQVSLPQILRPEKVGMIQDEFSGKQVNRPQIPFRG